MPVAVVSGASSGIGAASVEGLSRAGFHVVAGARREAQLRQVAEPAGAEWRRLDVTDPGSVAAFVAPLASCALLVNNAGGAHGQEPIAELDEQHWRTMWEVNVLGLARLTRALLPLLEAGAQGRPGHIVNVSSIAGFEVYRGGAGYTGAKHAVRAMTQTLRLELLGRPVRVTEVSPGLVETEFSLVRFDGDADRAAAIYQGLAPLRAEDVADCIVWAATRPAHVNIDEIVVRPIDQATATEVSRRR